MRADEELEAQVGTEDKTSSSGHDEGKESAAQVSGRGTS